MVDQRTKNNASDAVTATRLLYVEDQIKNTAKNKCGLSFGSLRATQSGSFQRFLGIVLPNLKRSRTTGSARPQKNILITSATHTSFLMEHTFISPGAL